MRDFVQLRNYLLGTLVLTACGSSTPPTTTPPQPTPSDAATAMTVDAMVAEVPVDAAPEEVVDSRPPPIDRTPSCPTGKWCGTASEAQSAKTKGAKIVLGCPTDLAGWSEDSGQPRPVPKSWPSNGLSMNLDEAATKARRDAKDAKTCCYTWVMPCPGGRALVVDGEIVRAPIEIPASTDLRDALAAAWLADASAEHASIASFARAALELMAVGAPPHLLEGVAAAMLDEVKHAEACFALAARYGRAVEPGPLPAAPTREATLVRLAIDTFI